jgi:hypothetical protein
MSRQTARFISSGAVLHCAISSMVRKHPSHSPVREFMLHTLMHGEGTLGASESGSKSFIAFFISTRHATQRRQPVRLSS